MDMEMDYGSQITEDFRFIKPYEKASFQEQQEKGIDLHYGEDFKMEAEKCSECYETEEESRLELAQAYVPFQKGCKTYHPTEGLLKGTVFPVLYKPYIAK